VLAIEVLDVADRRRRPLKLRRKAILARARLLDAGPVDAAGGPLTPSRHAALAGAQLR
jgi:hypothetical protein